MNNNVTSDLELIDESVLNTLAIENQDAALEESKSELVLSSQGPVKSVDGCEELWLDDDEDATFHNVKDETLAEAFDILKNEELINNEALSAEEIIDLFIMVPEEYAVEEGEEESPEWLEIKRDLVDRINIKRAEAKSLLAHSCAVYFNADEKALNTLSINRLKEMLGDKKPIAKKLKNEPKAQRYYETVHVIYNKRYDYKIETKFNWVESYDIVTEDISLKPLNECDHWSFSFAQITEWQKEDEKVNSILMKWRMALVEIWNDIKLLEEAAQNIKDTKKAYTLMNEAQDMRAKFRRLSVNIDKLDNRHKLDKKRRAALEKLAVWNWVLNKFVDYQQAHCKDKENSEFGWWDFIKRARATKGLKYFTESEYMVLPESVKNTCAVKEFEDKNGNLVKLYAPYSI